MLVCGLPGQGPLRKAQRTAFRSSGNGPPPITMGVYVARGAWAPKISVCFCMYTCTKICFRSRRGSEETQRTPGIKITLARAATAPRTLPAELRPGFSHGPRWLFLTGVSPKPSEAHGSPWGGVRSSQGRPGRRCTPKPAGRAGGATAEQWPGAQPPLPRSCWMGQQHGPAGPSREVAGPVGAFPAH